MPRLATGALRLSAAPFLGQCQGCPPSHARQLLCLRTLVLGPRVASSEQLSPIGSPTARAMPAHTVPALMTSTPSQTCCTRYVVPDRDLPDMVGKPTSSVRGTRSSCTGGAGSSAAGREGRGRRTSLSDRCMLAAAGATRSAALPPSKAVAVPLSRIDAPCGVLRKPAPEADAAAPLCMRSRSDLGLEGVTSSTPRLAHVLVMLCATCRSASATLHGAAPDAAAAAGDSTPPGPSLRRRTRAAASTAGKEAPDTGGTGGRSVTCSCATRSCSLFPCTAQSVGPSGVSMRP